METILTLLPTMPLLLTDAQNLLWFHSLSLQVDYLVIRPEEAEGTDIFVAWGGPSAKDLLGGQIGLVIKVAGVEQL